MMAHFALVVISLSYAAYIGYKKREFDLLTILAISTILFSSPVLVGVIAAPSGYSVKAPDVEVVVSFLIFNLIVFLVTAFYDASYSNANRPAATLKCDDFKTKYVIFSFGLISLALMLMFLLRNGGISAFFISKRELVDSADSTYLLFMWMITIWCSVVFVYKNNRLKIFAVLVLLLSVLLGNRTPVVISGLTVLLYKNLKKGKFSLLKSYGLKYPALAALCISVVSLMKPFYSHFRAEKLADFFELIKEEGLLSTIFRGLEFSRTQFIFNEIVINNFSTDGGHIFRGFLSILPVPRGIYTTPSNEFNTLFQPVLFPYHDSGLANNIQAEFFAAFGYIGVAFSAILLALSVVFLQKLVNKSRSVGAIILCLVGVLISFYSFRNSIGVTFGFIRLVIWPYFFVIFTYLILKRIN